MKCFGRVDPPWPPDALIEKKEDKSRNEKHGPTGQFTILEPPNLSIDVSELHKNSLSAGTVKRSVSCRKTGRKLGKA